MKNKKGFTLVELLAVIAILGILATISVVAVERTLNNSKNKATEIQEELINDAARAYAADNLSTCKNGCSVSIQDLINDGYIDDKEGIENRTALIHIIKNNNNYIVSAPDSNGNYIFNFAYTGSVQKFTIPETGTYKLEVWGAQGGDHSDNAHGGNGGYSKGEIELNAGTILYIYVGGQGQSVSDEQTYSSNAFGGGGKSYTGAQSNVLCGGGGGASDIRIAQDSLYSRVLVGGGGGGACAWSRESSYSSIGGVGGGTSGTSATTYKGSSQKNGSGGTINSAGTNSASSTLNGSFGTGGSASSSSGGGGGGGWYGGAAGRTNGAGGGGGSGYIYTSSTASNCPSGCLLNSSYYLTSASTYAGNTTFASPDGENETGHSGNGYARITKQ